MEAFVAALVPSLLADTVLINTDSDSFAADSSTLNLSSWRMRAGVLPRRTDDCRSAIGCGSVLLVGLRPQPHEPTRTVVAIPRTRVAERNGNMKRPRQNLVLVCPLLDEKRP